MDKDAKTLMEECRSRGVDIYKYGADLVEMAENELATNIWAVRFLYLHILRGGVCLRPPWSMVEHIGFGAEATNAGAEIWLKNPPLRTAPPLPAVWPAAVESPECSRLHQAICGGQPIKTNTLSRMIRRFARRMSGGGTG
jgi:hypothetical protein